MNALQAKECDMLRTLLEICDRLNIPCYLICGSALGAVKYGGFIPWDDDVDVALLRPDYERLLQQGQALLPDGLFLQTFRTDPPYPHIYAKLRDSRTTFVERGVAHLAINHGVYIDIFPLDGYPTGHMAACLLEIRKWVLSHQLACTFEKPPSRAGAMLWRLHRMMGCHRRTARLAARYEHVITRYFPNNTPLLCNHGNWQGKLDYCESRVFGCGVPACFEGLDVRVPEMYDEYLTRKYGDWRADLPPERQVGHHTALICDTDTPYTQYIKISHAPDGTPCSHAP